MQGGDILNKLRIFEIFAWILPGIVIGVPVTICFWDKLCDKQQVGLFLGFTIAISGYGVYCLGYLTDALLFRQKKEKKVLPEDISIHKIIWEHPQISEVHAEGALFCNMGIAFLVAFCVSLLFFFSLFPLFPPIFPLCLGILCVLSFWCYRGWLCKDYPQHLKYLSKNGM